MYMYTQNGRMNACECIFVIFVFYTNEIGGVTNKDKVLTNKSKSEAQQSLKVVTKCHTTD